MSDEQSRQRRHRRVPVEVPVRLSTIDPETDRRTGRPYFRASRVLSGNLSRGGAFIRTRDSIAPGRRVLVEMRLPDGRELEAVGRVAWARRVLTPEGTSEDSGVGVEFVGAAGDQLRQLEHFVEHQTEAGALRREAGPPQREE